MKAWQGWRNAAITTASMVWLFAAVDAAAPPAQVDVKGGRDHPLVQRFSGSWMVGYKANDWDQAQFPTSLVVKDGKWAQQPRSRVV